MTAKPTMLAVLLVLALPAAWGSPDWGYPQGHSYFHSHQYTMPLYGPPAAYAGQPGQESVGGAWSYGVNSREVPGGYLIELALRGIAPSEIQMQVRDGALVFERRQSSVGSGQGSFSFGSFFWTLPLPADADVSRAEGRADQNGIRLFIPKKGS